MEKFTDTDIQRLLSEVDQAELDYGDVLAQFDQRANDVDVATELLTQPNGDVNPEEVDALLNMYKDLDDLDKRSATVSQQLDKELSERLNALKGPVPTEAEIKARFKALRGPIPTDAQLSARLAALKGSVADDDEIIARADKLGSSVEENAALYTQHSPQKLQQFEKELETLISNRQTLRDNPDNRRSINKLTQQLEAVRMARRTRPKPAPIKSATKVSRQKLAESVHQATAKLQSRAKVVDACFGRKSEPVYLRHLNKIDQRANSNPQQAAQALSNFINVLKQKEAIIQQAKDVMSEPAVKADTAKSQQDSTTQQAWRNADNRQSPRGQQEQVVKMAIVSSEAAQQGASPGFLSMLSKFFNTVCKALFGSTPDKSPSSDPPRKS